jgi:hypothetical protein
VTDILIPQCGDVNLTGRQNTFEVRCGFLGQADASPEPISETAGCLNDSLDIT